MTGDRQELQLIRIEIAERTHSCCALGHLSTSAYRHTQGLMKETGTIDTQRKIYKTLHLNLSYSVCSYVSCMGRWALRQTDVLCRAPYVSLPQLVQAKG